MQKSVKPMVLKIRFIVFVILIVFIFTTIRPFVIRNINSIYIHWDIASSNADLKIPVYSSNGCKFHDIAYLTELNAGKLIHVLEQSCLKQLSIVAVQLGRNYAYNDKLSLRYYSLATELDETNANAWFYLGMAAVKLGNRNANLLFENALANISEATVGKSRILVRMAEVLILTQTPKDWKTITRILEEALLIDDFNDVLIEKALTYYYLGEYYRQNNQTDTAILYYEYSIETSDKSYWAYIKLAEILYLSNQDIVPCGCSNESCRRAEQLLLHATELKPDRVYAFNALGAYYEYHQDFSAAINIYKISLSIDSESNIILTEHLNILKESLKDGQHCRGS